MSIVNLFLSVAVVVSLVAVGSANVIVNIRSDNGAVLRHDNDVVDSSSANDSVDARNANVIVNVQSDDEVINARNAFEAVNSRSAIKAFGARTRTTYGCINNGDGCQPDGRQGTCCSGFCYKEPGWAAGYCK